MGVHVENPEGPAPVCPLCDGEKVIAHRLQAPREWKVEVCPQCNGRGRLHFPLIVPDGVPA